MCVCARECASLHLHCSLRALFTWGVGEAVLKRDALFNDVLPQLGHEQRRVEQVILIILCA